MLHDPLLGGLGVLPHGRHPPFWAGRDEGAHQAQLQCPKTGGEEGRRTRPVLGRLYWPASGMYLFCPHCWPVKPVPFELRKPKATSAQLTQATPPPSTPPATSAQLTQATPPPGLGCHDARVWSNTSSHKTNGKGAHLFYNRSVLTHRQLG